jgi:monomeric sarcosine oxidase
MKLGRRAFVKLVGAGVAGARGFVHELWAAPLAVVANAGCTQAMTAAKSYDVAVIGAGVFGAWTAYRLQQAGKKVVLVDAYGSANSRASSGGESRIIRTGYGPDEIYMQWSARALELWKEFFARTGRALFHRTGVLWLAVENDAYITATLENLRKHHLPHERLTRADLEKRFPQIALGAFTWGILEPESGALMARQAVQAVVEEAVRGGVEFQITRVAEPQGKGQLASIRGENGEEVHADTFVFACGPWLGKVFPKLLGGRIFPTRQEVFFFGVPAGDLRFAPPAMPTWIALADEVYGFPDLESRGIKVAIDRHGPEFDPDAGKRIVTPEGTEAVRAYVAKRFPALANAPIVETRVCQYENTSNGDFLIDCHPDFENVWLVGGGSGHGFKHGPAMGEYVTERVLHGDAIDPRFTLATKQTVQKRAIF